MPMNWFLMPFHFFMVFAYVCLVVFDSLRPHGLSSILGIFQARIMEQVAISYSKRSFQLWDQNTTLQADFLPSELPRKPLIKGKGVKETEWGT